MTQKQIKKDFETLQLLYEYIPQGVEIIQKSKYKFNSSICMSKKRVVQAKKCLLPNQNVEYARVKDDFDKVLKNRNSNQQQIFYGLYKSLKPSISSGDQLQELVNITSIENEGYTTKLTNWKPREGVVTLLNIGQICRSQFTELIVQNQLMFERNEHWKDKVEIVNIYFDFSLEHVIKYLKARNQASCKQYWLDEKYYKEYIQQLGFETKKWKKIGHIVVLNQNGEFVSKGCGEGAFLGKIEKHIEAQVIGVVKGEYQQKEQQEGKQAMQLSIEELRQKIRTAKPQLQDPDLKRGSKIVIKLMVINELTRDGKVILKESQAKLSYDQIQTTDKIILDDFITTLKKSIEPEPLIIKIKPLIDINEQQRQLKIQVHQICNKFGMHVSFQEKRIHTYQFVTQNQSFSRSSEISTQFKHSSLPTLTYQCVKREIEQMLLKFAYAAYSKYQKCISSKLTKSSRLKKGDDFIPIENYSNCKQQQEVLINHKQGQVLVIHYWRIIYVDSRDQLIENNEMMKSNQEKWGNQVRLVEIGAYNSKNTKKYFMETREIMSELELYAPIFDDTQVDYALYNVDFRQHHSYFIIVDKVGKIQVLSCLKDINLKDTIEQFLNPSEEQQKQELPQQEKIKQQTMISKTQMNELKYFIDMHKDLCKGIGTKSQFGIQISLIEYYVDDVDGEYIKAQKPKFEYWVGADKLEQLNKALSQLFKIVPREQFILNETIGKQFDIPFPGKECVLCKAELTDQIPQYYSVFNNEYVCVACAEYEDDTKEELERHKYPEKLIFINAPLTDLSVLTGIDEHMKGERKVTRDKCNGYSIYKNTFYCLSCYQLCQSIKHIPLKGMQGNRNWSVLINLNQMTWGFCQQCFMILKDKHSEAAQEIIKLKAEEGMCTDGLYIRVLESNRELF